MVSRSARATWNVKKRQWSRSTLKDGGRGSWGRGSGREVIGIHLPRGQWPSPPRPPPRRRETMGHGGKITEIAREFVRRVIKSSLIARRDWITAVADLISIWNPKDPTYVALQSWIPLPRIVSRHWIVYMYSRCGLIVLVPLLLPRCEEWKSEWNYTV